jgi:hypothetical protein
MRNVITRPTGDQSSPPARNHACGSQLSGAWFVTGMFVVVMIALIAAATEQKPPAPTSTPAQPSRNDDDHSAWARQVAALPADLKTAPDALFARPATHSG